MIYYEENETWHLNSQNLQIVESGAVEVVDNDMVREIRSSWFV